MPSLWPCKYEVAKSDLKLNSAPVYSKETLPKVIIHWKEGGQLPQGEEIINTFWSLRGLWPWERQSLSTSKTSAGCQGTRLNTGRPRAAGECVCVTRVCLSEQEERLRGLWLFIFVLGVSQVGCIENCFWFEHMGIFLLFPLPFCNSPSRLELFRTAFLRSEF